MKDINLVDLLKAGVHFGHKSSRWHPKMKPYIYGHRNNIHIFDLEKTKDKLEIALEFIKKEAAGGGTILFVGTKKQAKGVVREAAEKCQMPYVTERWLGGTFTNFRTIQKSMQKLQHLLKLRESEEIEAYTKKERLLMDREMNKLQKLFAGIESMNKLPQAVFVFSAQHDKIAIKEANKMNIPVIAVVDSNTSPEGVEYVIPGNDDAVKAIALYANEAAEVINAGRKSMPVEEVAPKAQVSAEEKTADTAGA